MDVLEDLETELARIEEILRTLSPADWDVESAAAGWSVADVVLHLAQSEELVVASLTSAGRGKSGISSGSMDASMQALVDAEHAPGEVVFARWQIAHRNALTALRNADPEQKFPWAAAPLKPTALATTRIAEHWAHMLDIVEPLSLSYPDTERLRHVAWLGHRSLPYAFSLVGLDPQPIKCVLQSPDGSTLDYGPEDAQSTITGGLGAFCRVGAQRLSPEDSGLVTTGPFGEAALRVLRNYAA